jgi:uncharacterized membrane protein
MMPPWGRLVIAAWLAAATIGVLVKYPSYWPWAILTAAGCAVNLAFYLYRR